MLCCIFSDLNVMPMSMKTVNKYNTFDVTERPYSIIKRIGDSTTYFLKNYNIHNKSVFNNEVMPRKLTKDKYCKEKFKLRDGKNNKHFIKKNITSEFSSLIDIGETNVKKWKLYKNKCLIKNDSDFVHYLLKLLEDKIGIKVLTSDKNSDNSASSPTNSVDEKITNNVSSDITKTQIILSSKPDNQKHYKNDLLSTQPNHTSGHNDNNTHEIEDESKIKETRVIKKEKIVNETMKSEYKVLTENGILESNTIVKHQKHFNDNLKICDNFKSSFHKINYLLDEQNVENNCANLNLKSEIEFNILETDLEHNNISNSTQNDVLLSNHVKKQKRKKLRRKDDKEAELKRRTKKKCHDIRKAPPLKLEPILQQDISVSEPIRTVDIENHNTATDTEENVEIDNVTIKIKLCLNCDSRHLQDTCPLLGNLKKIFDSITFEEWINNSEKIESEDNNYASVSLPSVCYLKEVNETHGLGVFAGTKIDKYVEMGPLIGPPIKEVNIPDDFNMKHIWEINYEEKPFYINTEDPSNSNWVRYIRPAETREKRNISGITRNKTVYLVTIHDINIDDELRYWIDDCTNSTSNGKRRLEKTNCGGCNLTFDHALYYRTHCSIFHDARYSLTIRKYHCKVCGQAILGKDNIVKHAAELHNGQGAYQCQFCKKFFLRLNYLEMHRTYGCAANPHRSRPLCDFCGRKFCQPQKLKVHIKRMHSEISLSEFQCPLCLKLLGSRAAVQRHAREVHRSTGNVSDSSSTPAALPQINLTTGTSLSCSRCGKLFQNKSNLKIHMLTHSGIKPFRCKEENCNAAFTTKQCLQFHYKKVHGFTEDIMPTIERSVEYTFEAYSGGQTIDDDLIQTTTTTVATNQIKKCINSPPKIFQNTSLDNDNSSKEYSNEPTDQQDHLQQSCSPLPTIVSRPTSPIEPSNGDSNSKDCTDIVKHSFQNVQPILSKGSKKWLGDITNHHQSNEICSVNFNDDPDPQHAGVPDDGGSVSSIILDVDESQPENNSESNKFTMCLNVYNPRHDSSNASLLVEAALDSVSDIQMNTESNQCTDNLVVSNLYPLSQQDNYNDISGVEPSRGGDDVTDYTDGLQNDEFSSPNSPLQNHLIHDYVRHHDDTSRIRNEYLIDVDRSSNHTPPRYDFNNISNDSDGAQNLTIKDKDRNLEQQLDFSSYKTHYGSDLDTTDLSIRKYDSLRAKFDLPDERDAYNITIDATDGRKSYDDIRINNEPYSDVMDTSELKNTVDEIRNKAYDSIDSEALRALKYDLESKYEIEIRNKGYDYDSTLDTDMRTSKSYIDTADFRATDRTFEPVILNSTELQGLDMSARSYHGFHTAASNVSRYHHMYGDTDRDSGVGYGPPTDILRVVSLDLTSQSRHGTTLHGLSHHGLLPDHSRLSLDQSRLIPSDHNLSVALLGTDTRLLSDHTTNRLLSNDQLSETRIVTSPDTHRMLSESTRLSTRGFSSYSMSPAAYHPSSLTARSHLGSPSHNPPSYHHYSGYY